MDFGALPLLRPREVRPRKKSIKKSRRRARPEKITLPSFALTVRLPRKFFPLKFQLSNLHSLHDLALHDLAFSAFFCVPWLSRVLIFRDKTFPKHPPPAVPTHLRPSIA